MTRKILLFVPGGGDFMAFLEVAMSIPQVCVSLPDRTTESLKHLM